MVKLGHIHHRMSYIAVYQPDLCGMLTVQRQFGLDGRGGYRRQMETTMERAVTRGLMAPAEFHRKRAEMMESLASGVDDGRTRTQGMFVHVLQP